MNKIKNNLYFFLGIAFFVYMFFLAGKTIYKDYKVNQEVDGLKEDISSLREENQELRSKIIYYQSESYKEKEARLKLGLQKEGESVIFIPNPTPPSQETEPQKPPLKTDNFKKWWDFIFKS